MEEGHPHDRSGAGKGFLRRGGGGDLRPGAPWRRSRAANQKSESESESGSESVLMVFIAWFKVVAMRAFFSAVGAATSSSFSLFLLLGLSELGGADLFVVLATAGAAGNLFPAVSLLAKQFKVG